MKMSASRLSVLLVSGLALGAALTAVHAAGIAPRDHGTCIRAGGEATMVTRGLAEFMAKAALGHAIENAGAKAAGPIQLECNEPAPLTYCRARQRACK